MTAIAVEGAGIKYSGDATVLKLRAIYERAFTPEGSATIPRKQYVEVAGTLDDGIFHYNAFELQATENGNPNNSYLNFDLYDGDGNYLTRVYSSIQVPAEPTETSLDELVDYNLAPCPPLDTDRFVLWRIFNQVIESLVSVAQKATSLTSGWGVVRLSAPAAVLGDPIVVGQFDPYWREETEWISFEAYNRDMAAVITAVGANVRGVKVNSEWLEDGNHTRTTPANLCVSFGANGSVRAINGAVVKIQAMAQPLAKKIFYTDSTSKVLLDKYAVPCMNNYWWSGIANTGNCTHDFDQMEESLELNKGGTLFIGPGTWKHDGKFLSKVSSTTVSEAIIEGAGNDPDGAGYGSGPQGNRGTVLLISNETDTNAANTKGVVDVIDFFRNVTLRNLCLSVGQSTIHSALTIRGDVNLGHPTSGFGFSAENVSFHAGNTLQNVSPLVKLDGTASWAEIVRVHFFNPTFICNGINAVAYYQRTTNSTVTFTNPSFTVQKNGRCMQLVAFGSLVIINPDWRGRAVTAAPTQTGTGGRSLSGVNVTSGLRVVTIDPLNASVFTENDLSQPITVGGTDTYITAIDDSKTARIRASAASTVVSGGATIRRYVDDPELSDCCLDIQGSGWKVTVIDGADENFNYFIKYSAGQFTFTFNMLGGLMQSKCKFSGGLGQFKFSGTTFFSGVFQDNNGFAVIEADHYQLLKRSAINFDTVEKASLWGVRTGTGTRILHQQGVHENYTFATDESLTGLEKTIHMPLTITTDDATIFTINDGAALTVLTDDQNKIIARFGIRDSANVRKLLYGFGFQRDASTGYWKFLWNQDGDVFNLGLWLYKGSLLVDKIAHIKGLLTLDAGLTVTGAYQGTGNIKTSGGLIGYSTGSGAGVNQATDRHTGVTLNKQNGYILIHSASLAAGAQEIFTVTNSFAAILSPPKQPVICYKTPDGSTIQQAPNVEVDIVKIATGSFDVRIKNTHATTALTDYVLVYFEIGAAANS